MPDYFGHIFEEICLQYLMHEMKKSNIKEFYEQFGQWWGTNPQKRKSEEIDIVFSNKNEILVGECKWQNTPIGKEVLFTLEDRSNLIKRNRNICFYLFSKSGFKKDLIELAKIRTDIKLVSTNDLLKVF